MRQARVATCLAAVLASALLPPTAAFAAPRERVLHDFSGGADGGLPSLSTPVPGPGGVFYGTTDSGGAAGGGVVFQLAPPGAGGGAWSETVLWSFGCGATDGCDPNGTLLRDSTGALYGATYTGGAFGAGTVYKLTPPAGGSGPWTSKILFAFSGGTDGGYPIGGLVRDGVGNLYGTTVGGGVAGNQGGAGGNGVVFRLSPPEGGGTAWTETVLYAFKGTGAGGDDGSLPSAGVTLGKGGVLYGTTEAGGLLGITAGCPWTDGCGTAFKLTQAKGGKTWTESLLFEFGATPQSGASPGSALIVSATGALYGSTAFGGADSSGFINRGVIFGLAPPASASGPWTETILKTMTQSPDFLGEPVGDLTADSAGALYGAALVFGPPGQGGILTNGGGIFKLTPPATVGGAWGYTALHTFTGDSGDFCRTGCNPYSGVHVGKNGVITGTTIAGGTHPMPPTNDGPGVVFQLVP
jgi:uncharacterized repeat protein (TIGR03803 family)